MKWNTIETVPKIKGKPLLIIQSGRRFVAEWDDDSGYFSTNEALDGIETEKYYQEFPGRLYSPEFWCYIDSTLEKELTNAQTCNDPYDR